MLDGGSPSADALGERLGVEDATRARALARERPAVFMVYDVMRLYGVPLDPRPLEERRAVLSRLDLSQATRIQISPAYDDGSALLAGVVAVNVAVLQLNVRLDELGRERIQLQGETKRLSSQLSSASANARIESQARTKLGLVRADPELTFHVQLAPPTK